MTWRLGAVGFAFVVICAGVAVHRPRLTFAGATMMLYATWI